MSINALIYERAKAGGIEIEVAPNGSRRQVIFPTGKRFEYAGTLANIAVRLGLVTVKEVETARGWIKCPHCNHYGDPQSMERWGHCGNCDGMAVQP